MSRNTLSARGLMFSASGALLLAITATLLIDRLQLDLTLARLIYQLEGERWSLRDQWLLSELLHHRGRQLSIALLAGFATLLTASLRVSRLKPWRAPLAYLVFSPLCASGLVLLGKQVTGVECPWSLQPFGGTLPYHPLWQQLFSGGTGRCFPAGHASAGYAWLALYFAAAACRPGWCPAALCLALGLGLIFGITQQLRGAHFLSHDIWSLALCWASNALLAFGLLHRKTDCDSGTRSTIMQGHPAAEPLPHVPTVSTAGR